MPGDLGHDVAGLARLGLSRSVPAAAGPRRRAGFAWYLSTWLTDSAYDSLLRDVAAEAGVQSALPDVPPGVAVSRRHGDDGTSWLFAFNHTGEPVTLSAVGVDLLSGKAVDPLQPRVVRTAG